MKLRSQYLCLAVSAAPALSGCVAHGADTAGARQETAIRVAAVERVYGDIAAQLGGSAVDVTTILNSPTADPHAYEATPRDADAVAAADVVIENGLGYDAFADKLVAASPRPGRTLVTAATLGGHRPGDNPHVWYEVRTLGRTVDALSAELERRAPAQRAEIERRRGAFHAWLAGFSMRLGSLRRRHGGARVAITEPVFDYVLQAARLEVATPRAYSHAIEEGNDPAPQDVDTMGALLAGRRVAALVYNRQTVEPSTTRLLELANAAHVAVVPVTETLPANESTQMWIDSEVAALERAL